MWEEKKQINNQTLGDITKVLAMVTDTVDSTADKLRKTTKNIQIYI